jgi:hypothetical protein
MIAERLDLAQGPHLWGRPLLLEQTRHGMGVGVAGNVAGEMTTGPPTPVAKI